MSCAGVRGSVREGVVQNQSADAGQTQQLTAVRTFLTPDSAAASTSARSPGSRASHPSSPKRLLAGNLRLRNCSKPCAASSQRSTCTHAGHQAQRQQRHERGFVGLYEHQWLPPTFPVLCFDVEVAMMQKSINATHRVAGPAPATAGPGSTRFACRITASSAAAGAPATHLPLLRVCQWPPALEALLYPGHLILLLQMLVFQGQRAAVCVSHDLYGLMQQPHSLSWSAVRLTCSNIKFHPAQ